MKKIVEFWVNGINWLINDELISFYTYFTIIFAECAFLWSQFSLSIAVPFTIIFFAHVINVIVFAWFKGFKGNQRTDVICSILYVSIFFMLFIVGCIFNILISIIVTIFPIIITCIWIILRIFQAAANFICTKMFYVLSQIIVIGCPYIIFVVSLSLIPNLSIILKILISILYLICIPFICLLEDETSASNIFELAEDIFEIERLKNPKNKMSEIDQIIDVTETKRLEDYGKTEE